MLDAELNTAPDSEFTAGSSRARSRSCTGSPPTHSLGGPRRHPPGLHHTRLRHHLLATTEDLILIPVLSNWGEVRQLEWLIGGGVGGSGPYVYTLPGTRNRYADPHTLDIAELYVRLIEANRQAEIELLRYDPEPYSHVQAGHLDLRPDAHIRVRKPDGVDQYFVEIDRVTEWRAQLTSKMRRYALAYEDWNPDGTFPWCSEFCQTSGVKDLSRQ